MKPHQIVASSFKPSTASESSSRTVAQRGAYPKAPTDKKSRKKKIPSSSEPKAPNVIRKKSSSKKQTTETQHAEELEVVEESGIKSLGNVSFDELYGHDLDMGADESPFDTQSEIKFVRNVKPTLNLTYQGSGSLLAHRELTEADLDLESMSDDEIELVSRFKADTDDDEENHFEHKEDLSKTDEVAVDNMID
ncbi:hypothetical protein Tco_1139690, partial [Tanacetum coccineum]